MRTFRFGFEMFAFVDSDPKEENKLRFIKKLRKQNPKKKSYCYSIS